MYNISNTQSGAIREEEILWGGPGGLELISEMKNSASERGVMERLEGREERERLTVNLR